MWNKTSEPLVLLFDLFTGYKAERLLCAFAKMNKILRNDTGQKNSRYFQAVMMISVQRFEAVKSYFPAVNDR